MQSQDNARLDIAMEKESMVRENAKTKKMAAGLERMLLEVEGRNAELAEELNRVKTITNGNPFNSPPSSKHGSTAAALALSPTFTESLTQQHNSAIAELNSMKDRITSELMPRKKRKQAGESNNNGADDENLLVEAFEQKNELLRHMETHVDSLVSQLSRAGEDLAAKDEMLNGMADAINDYEEERMALRGCVEKSEEMVRREGEMRREVEEEFDILKESVSEQQGVLTKSLENTNFSQQQQQQLQTKLLKTESEWSVKFEAAQAICGGLACILGGAISIKMTQEKKLAMAFANWRLNTSKSLGVAEVNLTSSKALEREKVDKQQLKTLQKTIIRNFILNVPSKYGHLIKFNDWDSAMSYLNEELKRRQS